jgi:hypothetical protein
MVFHIINSTKKIPETSRERNNFLQRNKNQITQKQHCIVKDNEVIAQNLREKCFHKILKTKISIPY